MRKVTAPIKREIWRSQHEKSFAITCDILGNDSFRYNKKSQEFIILFSTRLAGYSRNIFKGIHFRNNLKLIGED